MSAVRNLIQPVGDIITRRQKRAISPDFPYWNLSNVNTVLQNTNFPDYVPYLRDIKVEMPTYIQLNGTATVAGGSTTVTFSVSQAGIVSPGDWLYLHNIGIYVQVVSGSGTSYVIQELTTYAAGAVSRIDFSNTTSSFLGSWSGSVFTLTDNGQNRALCVALQEDFLMNGSLYTNWMILKHSGLVDVFISTTNLAVATRTITISSGILSGNSSIELYPYRTEVANQARHLQVLDAYFGMGGLEVVSGLRRRDKMQNHTHGTSGLAQHHSYAGLAGGGAATAYPSAGAIYGPTFYDGFGTPRLDQFNQPRTLGVHMYESVGRYIP